MSLLIGVFVSSILVLYGLVRTMGVKQKLLGLNVHYAIWNLALFVAVAVSTASDAGMPRQALVGAFALLSVADAIWAGLVARKEDRGIGRRQPPGGNAGGSNGRGASTSG